MIRLSILERNNACDAVVDAIDDFAAGPLTAGIMEIRTGAQPADPDVAATGTLLATLTFSVPAFGNAGAVNDGEAVAAAITPDTNAAATGTAGWFRIYDRTSTPARRALVDGDITTIGGGGDMEMISTSITAGDTVVCNSFKLTMPTNC